MKGKKNARPASQPVTLRLKSEIYEQLCIKAEEEGNTVQAVIRTLCAEGLKRRAKEEAGA